MATDMTEKTIYDCKAASINELDAMLRNVYMAIRFDADLWKYVEEDLPKNINWKLLRHIRVIGDDDILRLDRFDSIGIFRGFYLNADGTWLLLILPEKPHLGDYFSRCGEHLVSLWIWNSQMYSRNANKFPGLQHLSLRDNSQLDTIENLDKLTELNELTVENCPRLMELSGLGKLKKLTHLKLTDCHNLITLPDLHSLTHLTNLTLTGCTNLVSLSGLYDLPRLELLRLSGCSSLAELPDLNQFPQLMSLRLSGCRSLVRLPDFGLLSKLTVLDLSEMHIDCIPKSICRLNGLRYLDLSDSHINKLPDFLPDIACKFHAGSTEDFQKISFFFDIRIAELEGYSEERCNQKAEVALFDTTIEGVDMSIFEQPYEMVVEWFRDRNRVPLNEIKVVFLGDGEAGKSHTISRLLNDGGDPEETFDGQSTPGIVISNKEYELEGRKFQVHYWDFGGQEIMHSMHRIFLTGRTMYVILLNARDDTQGDRAKYWLHNVRSFAPNAPVLLVLNKIDQNQNASVDEPDLRGRYEKLTRIVRLSALKYTRDQFNECFTKVLLEEIRDTGFLDAQWPSAWIKVKESLENLDIEKKPYIMGDKYQEICSDCQVDSSQKDLLHWFNDLGVSFCFCDEGDYALEDYVILRPDWITNALYIILFNKLKDAKNGLIPHASIHEILRNAHSDPSIRCTLPQAKYSTGDIQYVLGVMRKFNLSFQYGTDHEFIPMLCQQNSTVDIQYYHRDEDTLEFNMEFDYLPNNLLHRLMVERHQELDMKNVWRTGGRFYLPGTALSSVVTVDDKVLHIFIRSEDDMHRRNTYLAMLKANVDKIVKKMGIKAPECKLVYKVHGERAIFSYERLLKMHARGRKEEYCEALDEDFLIADILNQAAPAASADLNILLDSMISACLHLQGNKNYRGWDENGRNSVVRDSLGDKGYIVLDQTLRGTSESGKSYGELDLLIQRVPNRPWVLCEALIAEGFTQKWNQHLDKLLNEYNPHGLPTLFLLTYVDCEKSKFKDIWGKYTQHISDDDPKNFIRMPKTISLDLHSEYDYIKIARCTYQKGSYTPDVYHIFVQMDVKEPRE